MVLVRQECESERHAGSEQESMSCREVLCRMHTRGSRGTDSGPPLLPCRSGIAWGMALGEGVAQHGTAPAQPGVEAARGGQAGLGVVAPGPNLRVSLRLPLR